MKFMIDSIVLAEFTYIYVGTLETRRIFFSIFFFIYTGSLKCN